MMPIREKILESINMIGEQFRHNPGMILSEDDLKCNIFHKMMLDDHFSEMLPTIEGQITCNRLHAELPWFNNQDELRLRPDLTIFEPHNLSIMHAIDPGIMLPRKAYNFMGDSYIIELKFYKAKSGIRAVSSDKIHSDIEKILRIFRRNRLQQPGIQINGVMVVFSRYKTNPTLIQEFREHAETEGIDFAYHEANQFLLRTGT